MKYYVSLLVLGMAVGVMPVAMAGMLDAENANNQDSAAVQDQIAKDNFAQDVADAKAEKEAAKTEADKAADEAKAKEQAKEAKEREDACKKAADSNVEVSEQMAAQKKCNEIAVDTKNPVSMAMGADARFQEAYNPPQNLLVGPDGHKQEISWAKYESFRQIGEAKGFSDEAIAGIAGRLQHESGIFSATKTGSMAAGDYMNGRYTSIGAAQWHKDRAGDLVNYINDQRSQRALANNTDYTAASTAINGKTAVGLKFSTYDQYNFVYEELPSQMSKANYNALKNSTSTGDAARIFTVYYERPANKLGQAFGRAGGNETLGNALSLFNAGDNAYIPDTSEWGNVKQLADYPGSNTGGYTMDDNSGLGQTLNNIIAGNGSLGGIVQSIMGQTGLLGGNNPMNNIMSLLNGQGGTMDMKRVLASLLMQHLSGGSDSKTSGKSSSDSEYADNSSDSKNYDSSTLKKLRSLCGGDLPKSKDAVMLMIKSCKA